MEFSKYLGVAEECSSSESGWTMYIVSSMHETSNNHHLHHGHGHDHDHGHDDDGIVVGHGDHNMYHNEDSDDSMVSDASSGPSRQGILRGSSKRRSGLRRESKHAVTKDLLCKNQRQVEKKLFNRRQRAQKEEEYKTQVDNKARNTN